MWMPIVASGGRRAQGDRVGQLVEMVAGNVRGGTIADCSHFPPEESPGEIVREILAATSNAGER